MLVGRIKALPILILFCCQNPDHVRNRVVLGLLQAMIVGKRVYDAAAALD